MNTSVYLATLDLMRRAHAVLERYRTGSCGEEDYNNDDVIAVDDAIQEFLAMASGDDSNE